MELIFNPMLSVQLFQHFSIKTIMVISLMVAKIRTARIKTITLMMMMIWAMVMMTSTQL